METVDILKLYGPLGMGWAAAIYLGRFILTRYDADINAKSSLASALEKLTEAIREVRK